MSKRKWTTQTLFGTVELQTRNADGYEIATLRRGGAKLMVARRPLDQGDPERRFYVGRQSRTEHQLLFGQPPAEFYHQRALAIQSLALLVDPPSWVERVIPSIGPSELARSARAEADVARGAILQRTPRTGRPADIKASTEECAALYGKLQMADSLAGVRRRRPAERIANPSSWCFVIQAPGGRRSFEEYPSQALAKERLSELRVQWREGGRNEITPTVARVRYGPKSAAGDFPDPIEYDSLDDWIDNLRLGAATGPRMWFAHWIRDHADAVLQMDGRLDRAPYGNGQFGVAIPTYGGRWVLKVTADEAEAQIARTLRDIREGGDPDALPSLVAFNRIARNGKFTRYWRPTDDQAALAKMWLDRFGRATGNIHILERADVEFVRDADPALAEEIDGPMSRPLRLMMRSSRVVFDQRWQNGLRPDKTELTIYLAACAELRVHPRFAQLGIDAFTALRDHGLVVSDLHSGNFALQRDGLLCVADIGFAPTNPNVATRIPDLAPVDRLKNP